MSTERVTVSLPSEVVEHARAAVAEGRATSVSSYVAETLRARVEKAQSLARLATTLGGAPAVDDLNAVRARWGLPALPTV